MAGGARQYGMPDDPRKTPPNVGISQYGSALKGTPEPEPKKEDPSPRRQVVDQFHKNSDVDVRRESQHHTLGSSDGQASPGPHNHDGSDSVEILAGYTLTGSKASPTTMWPSIIQCLVRLGATDNTTA